MTLEWKSYLQTMEHFDIMLIFAVVTSHVCNVIKVIVDRMPIVNDIPTTCVPVISCLNE